MSAESSSASHGIGLGSALAVVVSWSLYHSLFWATVHGVFGWLYVVYYYFNR